VNELKLHQVSFFLNSTTHKPVIIVSPVDCIPVARLCYDGAADARAVVTWPGAEVPARLNPLPDCSFVFQTFDSQIFELGDCCMAQSSAG